MSGADRTVRATRPVRAPKRQRGVTTVEFVMILPFFLLLVFMIFELGLAFATQELMDNAARDAARLIRIGTITGSNYATPLVDAICNDLSLTQFTLVPACQQNIQIYVAATNSGSPSGTGFTQLSTAAFGNGTMTQTEANLSADYDVILQVGYNYRWALPWTSVLAGNTMLISTIAFQTEPY
ncbi:hypothetical protein CY652_06140 [Burkholderia sp. WAC0059]|uniref:TadE/TadG family type IV pilus assembly protein n=1 Tax=Burkholderia sp. WAC0059 TaxID=2066022 RepID=UPI000C7F6524|nr:TadE/TadG family type IV pilus assembly protein [Burkholderia sp. WAC0059]PLZ03382.1 hypothetical protein CY652_06140 [Burkholderia sp. WAC0059]